MKKTLNAEIPHRLLRGFQREAFQNLYTDTSQLTVRSFANSGLMISPFIILVLIVFVVLITLSFIFLKNNIKMESNENNNISDNKIATINKLKMEKIILNTDDGIEIVGDYYFVPGSKFTGILLHMMSADRKSFEKFTDALNQSGISVLSIDLRGHGESINSTKGKLNYEKFTEQEHQASIFDVGAASNFLKVQGFAVENQFLIGASIGANLALKFLSENEKIKGVVLLSPGLNYKGILLDSLISEESAEKILFISSIEDLYSYQTIQTLYKKFPKSELLIFSGKEHGTDILKNHKESTEKIIFWLKSKLI